MLHYLRSMQQNRNFQVFSVPRARPENWAVPRAVSWGLRIVGSVEGGADSVGE